MLRWLSGRLSIQNFRRDFQLAQETLGIHEARTACDYMLRHIYAVKAAGRLGVEAELRALEDIHRTVLATLPSGWFRKPGREAIAMALLEDWVTAKREVLEGSLDPEIFQYIDDELWKFAKGRLQPQEIERLQLETVEGQIRKPARSENSCHPSAGV